MEPTELTRELKRVLPDDLAEELVSDFLKTKTDTATQVLERSAPGKFIETVVQILQYLDTKKYESSPKVDDYLKNLESRTTTLPDDLRITLARVARASYTLRNKRSIAHKGGVDPNIYDLRYLWSASQWILSEIARHVLSIDMPTAGKAIDSIQVAISPVVEDFGDRRLVLREGTSIEELLGLLIHYYPDYVPVSQIRKDMNRRSYSSVSYAIRATYGDRLIDGDTDQGYKLTALGHMRASDLLRAIA